MYYRAIDVLPTIPPFLTEYTRENPPSKPSQYVERAELQYALGVGPEIPLIITGTSEVDRTTFVHDIWEHGEWSKLCKIDVASAGSDFRVGLAAIAAIEPDSFVFTRYQLDRLAFEKSESISDIMISIVSAHTDISHSEMKAALQGSDLFHDFPHIYSSLYHALFDHDVLLVFDNVPKGMFYSLHDLAVNVGRQNSRGRIIITTSIRVPIAGRYEQTIERGLINLDASRI